MQLLSYFHKCVHKKNSTYNNVNMKSELERQMINSMHSFTSHGNSHLTCKDNQYISDKSFCLLNIICRSSVLHSFCTNTDN